MHANSMYLRAKVDGGCLGVPDCVDCPRVHTAYRSFHQPWEIESSQHLYYTTDIVPIKVSPPYMK